MIISEKGRDPYGNALEILGSYNPYRKELQVKAERINYWLSKGAQMTPTVNNLLVGKEIIDGQKVVASKKGKVSEKRQNQLKAKEDKKKKAATAAAAPVEEVVEAPAAEEATPEEKTEEAVA